MDQHDLVLQARGEEGELFPEFKGQDMIGSTETANVLFAPSHHLEKELVTVELIDRLRQDRKAQILSVGSGPAHLERYLVARQDIRKDQIVLADIDKTQLPKGFEKKIFSAIDKWPPLRRKFAAVLFPQSFTCLMEKDNEATKRNTLFHRAVRREGMIHLLLSALKLTEKGGEVRGDGPSMLATDVGALRHFLRQARYGVELDGDGWFSIALSVDSPEATLIKNKRDEILQLLEVVRFGEFKHNGEVEEENDQPLDYQSPYPHLIPLIRGQ